MTTWQAAADPTSRRQPAAPDLIKLHIGGEVRQPGWTVVNIQAGPAVDLVTDCVDLGAIGDATVGEIYASHVLEHLSLAEVRRALAEWHRVLAPSGRVLISVPDLAKLGPALAHPNLQSDVRDWIIAAIYGGQGDPYDFHKSGFTIETLSRKLRRAGFVDVTRVAEFDLFDDTSRMRLGPTMISLNVIARKPA